MTAYEEIICRISRLSDVELCEVSKRCSDAYKDRQRIKRGILKKELTDKLQAIMSEILNNDFTIDIEYLNSDGHDDCRRIILEPDENFKITLM